MWSESPPSILSTQLVHEDASQTPNPIKHWKQKQYFKGEAEVIELFMFVLVFFYLFEWGGIKPPSIQ